MTTLALLKATIANDLDRTDTSLDTEIAAAINTAIEHYQRYRFYFSEARSLTFSTVAAQSNYAAADNANIPLIKQIDLVHVTVGGIRYEMTREDFYDLETLYDTSASSGEPFRYAYFNREFWLYPIPGDVYTVRVLGLYKIAAPASDAEADNPWMTEAYELIRCRAKAYLGVHKQRDFESAQVLAAAEQQALDKLMAETAMRLGTGTIKGSGW